MRLDSPRDWRLVKRPARFLLDVVAAGTAFVAVTLAWLVPLTLALGVAGVPWGLFVGHVNQGALILPLDPPSPATRPVLQVAIWLPIAVALLGGRRALPSRRLLLARSPHPCSSPSCQPATRWTSRLVEDPGLYPWLNYFERRVWHPLHLPPGVCGLGRPGDAVAAMIRRRPTSLLAWYLLAGGLTALAIYPRVDTIHAMFAGPLLLVVGAWGLAWPTGLAGIAADRAGPRLPRLLVCRSPPCFRTSTGGM